MAKPSIFISSTYYDLKHIRSSLGQFIVSLGYEPILSENGNIAYSPTMPLDESCYRDAQKCDVFVLIVGGRYGSEVSVNRDEGGETEFYDNYDSVTKREFENAYKSDIPVYILIEKAVFSEYETYARNKDNETITYAHVDSISIFQFIDMILSKPRNNPVFQFENESEIEGWLKEQWAGLFKEMLGNQLELKRLESLSEKVAELGNINTTLKHYMESIIDKISGGDAAGKEVIAEEEKRMESERVLIKLTNMPLFLNFKVFDITAVAGKQAFIDALSLDDLAKRLEIASCNMLSASKALAYWKSAPEVIEEIQKVRQILKLPPLSFEL